MEVIQSKDIVVAPFVSIIVPSYNRSTTIFKTIDSILDQTCSFDYEIIIGDDCSEENLREILFQYQKRYNDRIKLIFHEENIGLGANWASCVKQCRGKYLAGCDNDDFWHNKDKLSLQVQFLEQNPDYGMVHSDYRELNRKTGRIREKVIHDIKYKESIIKANITGKYRCCNSSVMYRKSIIDKYVNLDDYIKYLFPLQDWNTWISIANYTKFHCLPISTTTVGKETESITRPKEYDIVRKRFDKEKVMYMYLCDKYPNDMLYNEKEYDIYVDNVLMNLAYSKFDYSQAKNYALKLESTGKKNIKIEFARSLLTFYIFALLKQIRSKLA